jgi:hypothetical protein
VKWRWGSEADGPRTAAVVGGGGGGGHRTAREAGWETAAGSGSDFDRTGRSAGAGGGVSGGGVRTSWVAMRRQMG